MPLSYPPVHGFYLREPWQDTTGLYKNSKVGCPFWFVGVIIPNNGGGDFRAFTIELMIKPLSYDGRKDFLTDRTDSTPSGEINTRNGFSLCADATNITLSCEDGTLLGPSPAVGDWAHVAITYNYSTKAVSLCLDGVEVGTFSDSYFDWGYERLRPNRPGLPADVEVANFRLWDHARTPEQLTQDMATDYPADEPGLIVSIAFSESYSHMEASEQTADMGAGYHTRIDLGGTHTHKTFEPVISKSLKLGARKFDALAKPEVVYHGQISGVVTVKGDPAAQRVMAFVRSTGKKVAETTSDSNGAYALTGLDPNAAHYVIALDKNLEYNGVIADNIVPEVPA